MYRLLEYLRQLCFLDRRNVTLLSGTPIKLRQFFLSSGIEYSELAGPDRFYADNGGLWRHDKSIPHNRCDCVRIEARPSEKSGCNDSPHLRRKNERPATVSIWVLREIEWLEAKRIARHH